MRVRAKCKCGAELDVKSLLAGNVGDVWDMWDRLHARCYGLQRVTTVIESERSEADSAQDPQETTAE